MKILILGAAGKTGRHVLSQALDRGYGVVAFVRNPEKLDEQANLTIITGDASNADDIKKAAQGCDAVISALGHTSTAHSTVQTDAMRALIQVLGPGTRIISLTGSGVTDPSDPKLALTGRFLNAMVKLIPGGMFDDGAGHAKLLRDSALDWTLIRAQLLKGGAGTGRYELGFFNLGGTDSVARADVALAMLDCLTSNTWSRKAPMIRYPR